MLCLPKLGTVELTSPYKLSVGSSSDTTSPQFQCFPDRLIFDVTPLKLQCRVDIMGDLLRSNDQTIPACTPN